jgi:transposase
MFVQNHHTLEELQRLTKALTKKRIWLRHQAVVLAMQGHSAPAIAQALGCSRRAVQTWVARYNQGGDSALQERPHTGRPPRLAGPDLLRFQERIDAGPKPEDGVCTLRCRDLRRILEEEFGVCLRRQAVYDLLHRLDYSSLMPRPQHEQANPEVQEFFQEIVVEQIDAIAAAHPEKEVHTYFQDEARFGQKGTITRVWARRGSRPRAVQQTGYTSLYVLAAVCAATGAMSACTEHRGGQPVPGAVLAGVAHRGACGADLGWGGLPHRFGCGGAEQCEPDPTAAVLAGAEPGGEPVALLAFASLVEPPVPGLRRVAGRGGQEFVCGPRRHGNDQDCLQCSIYPKERMKLPERV